MASISANGAKGYHKFTLTVSENSTSTENNTSTVKYTFQISPVQTSWAWSSWGSSISYTVTINGTNYTGTIPSYDGYATVTLKSGSQTVTHNSDGSKSISYSFSVTDGAGQYYTPGNASASGTLALTTIPRATTPKLSSSSISVDGSNFVNITLNPASTSFKHKVRYAFGGLKNQSSGMAIGSNFSSKGDVTVKFTPPTSTLLEIPTVFSGVCTITCYTYTSDGTSVGSKTVNLTFNVPDYTPEIAKIDLTGNKLLNNTYVGGKSTVTVETAARSLFGATIKSYSSTINGKTYSGSKFTTSALTKGDYTISIKVTDTRGKTHTASATKFTVYEYFSPKITELKLERQSDETTVVATIKGSVASINSKNAKTLSISFNGTNESVTPSSYTINHTKTFTDVSTDNTLTATVKLTDSYTTVTKTFVLPTVAVTMDFHYSGKGVAFGKVAENTDESGNSTELLDVNWDMLMRKKTEVSNADFIPFSVRRKNSDLAAAMGFRNSYGLLGAIGMNYAPDGGLKRWTADTKTSYLVLDTGNTADRIVEQGTSGDWIYEKWNSGVAKCYTSVSVKDVPITTAWGALYQSDLIKLPAFPSEVPFPSAPRVFLQFSNIGGHTALISGASNVSKTSSGEAYLFRPAAATLSNGAIVIEAIGKWK